MPAYIQAFDCTYWYLRGLAGLNFLSFSSSKNADIEANAGYALGGALGKRIYKNFRAEGEFTYRHNVLNELTFTYNEGHFAFGLDGSVSSFSYMGNLFFDWPVCWSVVPYLGAGLGGYNEWGSASIPAFSGTAAEEKIKIKKYGGAYQVIVGLNFMNACTIDGDIEYHFFDTFASSSAHNHLVAISFRKTF